MEARLPRLNSAGFFSTVCLISGATAVGLIALDASHLPRHAHITEISAAVPGKIIAIYAEKNQHVLAGQILAEMDGERYRAVLLEARKALVGSELRFEDALENLHRIRRSYLRGMACQADIESERAGLVALRGVIERDREGVERARADLARTKIRAPATGVLADSAVVPGMDVSRGTVTFRLASPARDRSRLGKAFAYDSPGR